MSRFLAISATRRSESRGIDTLLSQAARSTSTCGVSVPLMLTCHCSLHVTSARDGKTCDRPATAVATSSFCAAEETACLRRSAILLDRSCAGLASGRSPPWGPTGSDGRRDAGHKDGGECGEAEAAIQGDASGIRECRCVSLREAVGREEEGRGPNARGRGGGRRVATMAVLVRTLNEHGRRVSKRERGVVHLVVCQWWRWLGGGIAGC